VRRCAEAAGEARAPAGRSFAGTAGVVAALSLLSKVLGMVREGVIASHFGTSATADAFNFASCVPVLCVTTIGGLNGALHSAVTSVTANMCVSGCRVGRDWALCDACAHA